MLNTKEELKSRATLLLSTVSIDSDNRVIETGYPRASLLGLLRELRNMIYLFAYAETPLMVGDARIKISEYLKMMPQLFNSHEAPIWMNERYPIGILEHEATEVILSQSTIQLFLGTHFNLRPVATVVPALRTRFSMVTSIELNFLMLEDRVLWPCEIIDQLRKFKCLRNLRLVFLFPTSTDIPARRFYDVLVNHVNPWVGTARNSQQPARTQKCEVQVSLVAEGLPPAIMTAPLKYENLARVHDEIFERRRCRF